MTAIDLSSYAGLVAVGLLTLNILVGLLLSVKYNPVRRWPHRRINTFKIHNWTAYFALAACALHPVILLFSSTAHFGVVDIVYPVHAPKQPTVNVFGALALYVLIFIVVTSYYRIEIGRLWWKRMHFATYAMFVLYAIHSILTDPNLKDLPIDPLDGEKVYVELCVIIVLAATVVRWRWHLKQPPPRHHLPSHPERSAKHAARLSRRLTDRSSRRSPVLRPCSNRAPTVLQPCSNRAPTVLRARRGSNRRSMIAQRAEAAAMSQSRLRGAGSVRVDAIELCLHAALSPWRDTCC